MRFLRGGAAAVLMAAVVHLFAARQQPDLMVQAQMNLLFAQRPLDAAFEKYPRLRPPLYPLVLWTAARVGLPPRAVHEGLLVALLAGMAAVLAGAVRRTTLVASVGIFALAHFNYVNAAQFTAETLFAPLALALVAALRAYGRRPAWPALLTVAGLASLLALTRYFGLQFALPLAAAMIAWRARPWRRAAAHAGALAAVALVPVGFWMWITFQQTGFLTGTDRSRVRALPESVRHWEDITGAGDHAVVAARTLWVDFFSPSLYAAHSVVTRGYTPSLAEWMALALVCACAASVVAAWRRPPPPARPAAHTPLAAVGEGRLEAIAFAWYVVATIAVWSVSNNDPIYTRFLFPAYPLLWIALTRAYEDVATRTRWAPAWWILAAAFAALHAARSWRAEALPVRYF